MTNTEVLIGAGSVVGVTRLRAGHPRSRLIFRFPAETNDFSLLQNVHTALEEHLVPYTIGSGVNFLGVKRQGLEVGNVSSCNAEFKN